MGDQGWWLSASLWARQLQGGGGSFPWRDQISGSLHPQTQHSDSGQEHAEEALVPASVFLQKGAHFFAHRFQRRVRAFRSVTFGSRRVCWLARSKVNYTLFVFFFKFFYVVSRLTLQKLILQVQRGCSSLARRHWGWHQWWSSAVIHCLAL